MIIFPGGVRQKRNFRRGGGVHFGSQFLENPEGRGGHRKNPFHGGGEGMDSFWNYTMSSKAELKEEGKGGRGVQAPLISFPPPTPGPFPTAKTP